MNRDDAHRAKDRFASFGGAAVGGPREMASPIYEAAFLDDLENIAREHLTDLAPMAKVERLMDQRKSWIRLQDLDGNWRSELEAHRDGSVGVHFWSGAYVSFDPLQLVVGQGHIASALGAIVAVLGRSGASGQVRALVSVRKELHRGSAAVDLGRWIDLVKPAEADVESIKRDLRRGAQEFVVEPS